MGIAIYRMTLRKKMLTLMQELSRINAIANRILRGACRHVMIGYTHTQQAQPTTFAHYLKAVVDQLGRDFKRIQSAYKLLTEQYGGGGIDDDRISISRERMQELLGV